MYSCFFLGALHFTLVWIFLLAAGVALVLLFGGNSDYLAFVYPISAIVAMTWYGVHGYKLSSVKGLGILHKNYLVLKLSKKRYILDYDEIEKAEIFYTSRRGERLEIISKNGPYIEIYISGGIFLFKNKYSPKHIYAFQRALKKKLESQKKIKNL